MTKAEVRVALESLVHWRLFESSSWLGDWEINRATKRTLEALGLQVELPNGDLIATPLGRELDVNLLAILAGHHDEHQVPELLARRGLIEESFAEDLMGRLERGGNPERVLRPVVQAVYRRLCVRM